MHSLQDPPALFCIGYSYCAQVLGSRLASRGWRIITTARDADKAKTLREGGIKTLDWPIDDLAAVLPPNAHVLISAPPAPEGDPFLAAHHADLLALKNRVAWIGYLSTTAVYGDHQGGEVDENTPLKASSERGKRRVLAEHAWLAMADDGLPVHTFRLAGIYGPGRGPFEKIRRGVAQRIVKEGQVFGRIHVEDIATVLEASIAQPNPGTAYNVTDDLTCPPQEVIGHAADLLGMPRPPLVPFEEADMSPMARSFYGENKRVLNHRIKTDLGVTLAYPTYREGFAGILAAED